MNRAWILAGLLAAGASPVAPLNRSAIEKELTDFSLAGRDRRLGPDYEFYHRASANAPFPEIEMPTTKVGGKNWHYQIGGPWTRDAGDFSSTQGQILYVPDAGEFGVDRVTIIEWTNGCFTEKPEPPWWGGFRPEPFSAGWLKAAGGTLGQPVFMARGQGLWANCGVIVFSSGLVATAGTCTGHGSNPTFQLPPDKVPTAISVTSRNEFALITVFDRRTKQGQVAVLALESAGRGFAHEWREANPGLVNVAMFTGIKLLGFVDLPGISYPTAICGVGNTTQNRVNGPDGNAGGLGMFDLSDQACRDRFRHGDNASFVSTTGFAVVAAKYEQKVAFLDLQPLFQRVAEMYLTTPENYAKTRHLGPQPNQWPYSFGADPGWRPTVVKVLDHPQPTAVLASLAGGRNARAFVASLDGDIGIYEVGGLATTEPASPDEIRLVGHVQVGRNPVWLAYQKLSQDTFLAVSRGDREIAWVKHTGNNATVFRRLRDARLLDPVHVEVADTHGIETPLLTVADFHGRKIINYRYGQLVFATQGGARFGMGSDGQAEFECGGVLEFPGAPFCISATNVN